MEYTKYSGVQPVADDVYVYIKWSDGDISQGEARNFHWDISHPDCVEYWSADLDRKPTAPLAVEYSNGVNSSDPAIVARTYAKFGFPVDNGCCGHFHDSTAPSAAQEYGLDDADFEFY